MDRPVVEVNVLTNLGRSGEFFHEIAVKAGDKVWSLYGISQDKSSLIFKLVRTDKYEAIKRGSLHQFMPLRQLTDLLEQNIGILFDPLAVDGKDGRDTITLPIPGRSPVEKK